LKVTDIHMHYSSANIWEMLHDGDIVTLDSKIEIVLCICLMSLSIN